MSKPKVILFDVDGLLIRLPHYFTKVLEDRGYKGAGAVMEKFYSEEMNVVYNEGRGDAREMALPYLREFGWKGTADEIFDEQFRFEKDYLDKDLIDLIGKLKEEGTVCCIATDQERHRAKYILEEMGFKDIFDRWYISCDIGARKCDAKFWEKVLEDLGGIVPSAQAWDIVYFDDVNKNVDAASNFGLRSFLFTNKIQFENDMNMLGFDVSLNKFSS